MNSSKGLKVGVGKLASILLKRTLVEVGESVEQLESGCGWRNESNVSPEGSLNFFPDSTNSVRHGNGFISISPFFF